MSYRKKSGPICLSPSLTDEAITVLIEKGLSKRYPNACQAWQFRKSEIERDIRDYKKAEMDDIKSNATPEDELSTMLKTVILRFVLVRFPWVFRCNVCSPFDPPAPGH